MFFPTLATETRIFLTVSIVLLGLAGTLSLANVYHLYDQKDVAWTLNNFHMPLSLTSKITAVLIWLGIALNAVYLALTYRTNAGVPGENLSHISMIAALTCFAIPPALTRILIDLTARHSKHVKYCFEFPKWLNWLAYAPSIIVTTAAYVTLWFAYMHEI
jgi:hypothetical protein